VEVALVSPKSEGGTRRKFLVPPSRLSLYVLCVGAGGVGTIALVVFATPWSATVATVPIFASIFLAAAAIAGEVKPIQMVLGDSETRGLSTSAPFVLALIPVAGVGPAVLAQAMASIADDMFNRRSPKKSLFNTAQYALSVTTAGLVYTLLIGEPFLVPPSPVETSHLGALLIAGIAMVAANWLLVAGVVSIAASQPLLFVLRSDARPTLVIHLVLLSVGGIAAVVAPQGVATLALLLPPVVAAHLFAAAAARHAHEATHDSLTGLGNRGQADHELSHALEGARQAQVEGPGLVLLDLDHFKDFNDTLGHPVGDVILREVARRLTAAAPPGASVHRLGGDEFVVVVDGGLADSSAVAQDVLASFNAPVQVESLELLVTASVGIAVAPQHGGDVETLMKNSDIALYHAKVERDRISVYSEEFDVNTVERLQLLTDLRTALEAEQLYLVYQPQVDLTHGRTVAVEALVRWQHPERGLVEPDGFIPLAENSGLIYPLTAYVLDAALAQLAGWRAGGHDIRMSVNLSARHLSDLALPGQVADALSKHGIPAPALVLEVTETGILSDSIRADMVIGAIRDIGVEIAIDDYGTGNASLSYLKRLDIDELKVDRSFVSNIGADSQDLIIVRSTIELALALGLRVVAEGIEDEWTADALRELGGVIGQGYFLGRPVAPAQVTARLEEERAAAAAGESAPA
jgi:diguanylate cyclase (GGDEF)-like protein